MPNTKYETSDTPLAAWLVCNQIKLLEVNTAISPVEFIFDSTGKEQLNDLIFQWDSGNAVGNCNSFYRTYRSLVHKLKEG